MLRGNLQVFKRLILAVSMFIICLLLVGCSSFQINENINGKKIIFDNTKFLHLIQENGITRPLVVKYNQKVCAVFCVIQNNDKTNAVLKVSTLTSKTYHRIRMPQRFILLVSKNRVIYNLESPDLTSIQWIDNNQFLIIREHQRLIIDKSGKVISNEGSKNDLLKQAPHDTVF